MSQNKEDLKNKIIYRASYRGTKEMDILMLGFVRNIINRLSIEELEALNGFVNLDDELLISIKKKESLLNFSDENLLKIVSEFEKRKEYVFNELNKLEKISCFEPGGAFYAFPNISKTGLSGNKFSEIALEEKGVALVPGSSFGDNAGEFVRISFANSLENIKEAINRLSTI